MKFCDCIAMGIIRCDKHESAIFQLLYNNIVSVCGIFDKFQAICIAQFARVLLLGIVSCAMSLGARFHASHPHRCSTVFATGLFGYVVSDIAQVFRSVRAFEIGPFVDQVEEPDGTFLGSLAGLHRSRPR